MQNSKEPGSTSLLDLTSQQSKESTTDPSVQQEGEFDLSTSHKIDSVQDEEKRQRTLSQKAIHNAIQTKGTELTKQGKTLRSVSDTVLSAIEKNIADKEIEAVLRPLQQAYMKYKGLLRDINELAENDKWGEVDTQITEINEASKYYLTYASTAIDKATEQQTNLTRETRTVSSRRTRRTRSSRTSSSSNARRMMALAEAAAAKKQAEFEQLMAEKESEKRQRDAEEEFHREQRRAQYERDMAILAAEKRKAVAHAKLKAIEQSILEEETPTPLPVELGAEDTRSRTQSWVNAQEQHTTPTRSKLRDLTHPTVIMSQTHQNLFLNPMTQTKAIPPYLLHGCSQGISLFIDLQLHLQKWSWQTNASKELRKLTKRLLLV